MEAQTDHGWTDTDEGEGGDEEGVVQPNPEDEMELVLDELFPRPVMAPRGPPPGTPPGTPPVFRMPPPARVPQLRRMAYAPPPLAPRMPAATPRLNFLGMPAATPTTPGPNFLGTPTTPGPNFSSVPATPGSNFSSVPHTPVGPLQPGYYARNPEPHQHPFDD